MTELLSFTISEAIPARDLVLESQGVPADRPVAPAVDELLTQALTVLEEAIEPAGMICEISTEEFARIYQGVGENAPSTPLEKIAPQATHTALFATTVGAKVCRAIDHCFQGEDFALAYMLDAAASASVDLLAQRVEADRHQRLCGQASMATDAATLRYSPGYCGWHVTGQGALFARLGPDQIGVTLNENSLMQPLKSISGVLITGPKDIHSFTNDYDFCSDCEDKSCRARIP